MAKCTRARRKEYVRIVAGTILPIFVYVCLVAIQGYGWRGRQTLVIQIRITISFDRQNNIRQSPNVHHHH